MIFRFNEAQLSRGLHTELIKFSSDFQKGTDTEIEVWPLEFPEKFSIKAGDDVTVIAWDADCGIYKIMPSPEPEPEPSTGTEPELAPVLEGVKTLARDLFDDVKAMDSEQRQIFWAEVSSIITKELL